MPCQSRRARLRGCGEAARRLRAGLLVVARRHATRLEALGRVVHRAPCSVLVIGPPA